MRQVSFIRKFIFIFLKKEFLRICINDNKNMVRTKADRVPTKAVGSKAPAKFGDSSKKSNSSKGKSHAVGNPYHPRETPKWQKPITSFINKSTTSQTSSDASSSSSSSKDTEHLNIEESVGEDNEND